LWDEDHLAPHQNLVQVWFAGVHSDVGGWYDQRGLSDITLIWMLENAEKHGLRLKPKWLLAVMAAGDTADSRGRQHSLIGADSHGRKEGLFSATTGQVHIR
jgi:hypothetical protein